MNETKERNLRVLAKCFTDGNVSELRSIMAHNFVFYSESSQKEITNIDSLVERMSHVAKDANVRCAIGTVTNVPVSCTFSQGMRCIMLYYGKDLSNPDCAVVSFSDDGTINRIYISNDVRVRFILDHPEDFPLDNNIEQRISELLADFSGDEDETELAEYLARQEPFYSDDIYDFAFREAIRQGIVAYIEEHVDDFDLNDGCGYSTYLQETDDEEIQSLLMEYGAFRSWDEYSDCKFAMETVNCSVLAFDSDFQQEVFEKYLETFNITEEDAATMLEDEDASDAFDAEHNRCFTDDMTALGVEAQGGEISFVDKEDDDGMNLRDLIEELGWGCSFEGEQWKLETNGVYFIL